MRCLVSAEMLSVNGILLQWEIDTKTFQSNGTIIYELIWLELHRNISDSGFEMSSELQDS